MSSWSRTLTIVALYIMGLAHPYLRELCCPTAQVQRRCCPRSAPQAEFIVPRSRTATKQRRAFSVANPATWNGLPVTLRQIPVDRSISFLSALETAMFERGWAGSAFE